MSPKPTARRAWSSIVVASFAAFASATTAASGCGHAPTSSLGVGAPRQEAGPPQHSGLVTISMLGLNDVHGAIVERTITVDNGVTRESLRVGGVATMKAYFDIARRLNPKRTLIFDAGDAYQGSYLSNHFNGIPVVHAYNALGVTASTFGNHEWDFGPVESRPGDAQGSTKDIVAEANFDFISANVVSEGKDVLEGYPKSITPYKLYCLPLGAPCSCPADASSCTAASVRIGVIGATTENTPKEANPKGLLGMKFLPMTERVMATAQSLRVSQRVNMVVLVAHEGGQCDMTKPASDGDSACATSPITEMLDAMRSGPLHDKYPLGGVDAVFSGHVHAPQAHFIRGVPVVQNKDKGKSFSQIDFTIDADAPYDAPRTARIPQTVISRPTFFCRDHLAQYASCVSTIDADIFGGVFPGYPRGDLGARVPATYRGQAVIVDDSVNQSLEPHYTQAKPIIGERIVALPSAPLLNDRFHESPLGDCVADASVEQVRDELKMQVDVYISQSGGLRESLPEHEVTFDDVFSVMPFSDTLSIVELTGAEVELFGLSLSQIPKNIAVISAGWKIQLTKQDKVFPRHRGFIGPDGKPLSPSRSYRVLTGSFTTREGVSVVPGQSADVFRKARAEGRVHEVTAFRDRDLFLHRIKRTDTPLPASCRGALLDRTVFVDGP